MSPLVAPAGILPGWSEKGVAPVLLGTPQSKAEMISGFRTRATSDRGVTRHEDRPVRHRRNYHIPLAAGLWSRERKGSLERLGLSVSRGQRGPDSRNRRTT